VPVLVRGEEDELGTQPLRGTPSHPPPHPLRAGGRGAHEDAAGVVDRDRLVTRHGALGDGGGHRPVRDPQDGASQRRCRRGCPGGRRGGRQATAWRGGRAAGVGPVAAAGGAVTAASGSGPAPATAAGRWASVVTASPPVPAVAAAPAQPGPAAAAGRSQPGPAATARRCPTTPTTAAADS